MSSPVNSNDFKNVVSDPSSSLCGGFTNALLKLPVILYQFINWLLDTSGNVTNAFKQEIIPPGFIMNSFVDISSPAWLKCDGSELSQAAYPELFDAIGNTFGAAAPGNFKLPDCRARFMVTIGTFPSTTNINVGSTGGEETHVLVEAEIPKIQLGLIAASGTDALWIATDGTGPSKNGQQIGATGIADKPEILTEPFGNDPGPDGQAHNNLPPYIGVWTYIKT